MIFPKPFDILETFGLEPVEEDSSIGYYLYTIHSFNYNIDMDISFNGIERSFQVVLRCNGKEISTVSSEKVKSVKIRKDLSGSGIHVLFDYSDESAEALITLEPELKFSWWILAN